MKVALYARVSKADDTQDPEAQLLRLRAHARDRGFEIFGEFVDRASGADAHRPALDRMLAEARGHRFSMVLTVKVDRIARSVPNLYALLSDLDSRGVAFQCTDQDISTTSASGKLLLAILGGVAEFERSLISERTKAGLARAKAKGVQLGQRRLKIEIAQILELRSQGLSLRVIAAKLGCSHQTVKNRLRQSKGGPPFSKDRAAGKGG